MRKNTSKGLLLLCTLSVLLIGVQFAWAANTPWWWTNHQGYAQFHQVASSGTIENTVIIPPGNAVIATVNVDIPNEFNQTLSKNLWMQVEWTIVTGTGDLVIAGNYAPYARWMNDPGSCPTNPRDPYPDPPNGQGPLVDQLNFSSSHGFDNGREFSISGINPQPACERVTLTFIVDPNSKINYRVEVQTVCLAWDWGDAPDDPQSPADYPTLAASNGASHAIVPNFMFGALEDAEGDGQPTANADGDDNNASDDEDAIASVPISLTVGAVPVIHLPVIAPVGQSFSVTGWIDLNDDGVWDLVNEYATANGIGAGIGSPIDVVLTFPNAPAAPTVLTFARFRLSTDLASIATPMGMALDGEVEDYPVEILQRQPDQDFGDAPDPTYPTLIVSNGAAHVIVPNLFMGNAVDPEQNGQPTANADGDDLDFDGDDEDSFPAGPILLTVGVAPAITIPVTAPAGVGFTVNGWIDMNVNGAWETPAEFATVNGVGTGASINVVLNFLPPAAPALLTFARFRLSSNAAAIALPTGQAPDGEVEDYPIIIQEAEPDFGDAPDPGYPSLFASNGARHTIFPGLYMGNLIDGEMDSHQLAGNAASDDIDDGSDDEDSVDPAQLVFTEGQQRNVAVNVNTPAMMTVWVSAWVDFNGDQVWDASEMTFGRWTGAGAGVVTLTFPICPIGSATQTSGHSYARFRLCSDSLSIISPTGAAHDGEVEDYPVDILVPVELTSFSAIFVNNTIRLEWTTQSETENLGFHIFRSESLNGNYGRITQNIISGAGTSESIHKYQFIDQTIQPGKTYYYKLADVNYNGVMSLHGPLTVQTAPKNYGLEQNYPNPFNPQTKIAFSMKEAGEVELNIYNLRGQLVRKLVSQQLPVGEHSVVWDSRSDAGQLMPSGTYLYKVRINGYEETKKMELLK